MGNTTTGATPALACSLGIPLPLAYASLTSAHNRNKKAVRLFRGSLFSPSVHVGYFTIYTSPTSTVLARSFRMKLNTAPTPILTHEGARAHRITPEQQLRRSVMSCLLWEDEFYESGESIAKRIGDIIPQVDPLVVAGVARQARTEMNLRHVPLLLCSEMLKHEKHRPLVGDTLAAVIQRPDELTEFLAIYSRGREGAKKLNKLANQAKKGLALAFQKFSAYSLAKYNRDGQIKLRDALFLCHAKPKDDEQAAVWKQLVSGTLPTPDTWEVELSGKGGEGKKESWERLLRENKLGSLALLRNLRNMQNADVDTELIRASIKVMDTTRVLPFRFIAAARYAPKFEPELEQAMFQNLEDKPRFAGKTLLLVDVSGSMTGGLSSKSDMTRGDAANGLAMVLRELCGDLDVLSFSNKLVLCPPRRGFALRDCIDQSQSHLGTYLGKALKDCADMEFDRLIVITDEQSHDAVPQFPGRKCYMINVASAQNGVGYGAWTHLDGFSEAIVQYLHMLESCE